MTERYQAGFTPHGGIVSVGRGRRRENLALAALAIGCIAGIIFVQWFV